MHEAVAILTDGWIISRARVSLYRGSLAGPDRTRNARLSCVPDPTILFLVKGVIRALPKEDNRLSAERQLFRSFSRTGDRGPEAILACFDAICNCTLEHNAVAQPGIRNATA
jgi:hypothetical protein